MISNMKQITTQNAHKACRQCWIGCTMSKRLRCVFWKGSFVELPENPTQVTKNSPQNKGVFEREVVLNNFQKTSTKLTSWDNCNLIWVLVDACGYHGPTCAVHWAGHVFQYTVLQDFASKLRPLWEPKNHSWGPKMTR